MPSPDSIQQRLKWVLLPKGISDDGQELVFSVFLAPAMTANDVDGAPTLATFVDFVDWPATLSTIAFAVELSSGSVVPARMLPFERSSALWQQLFPPTTRVAPFTGEDLSGRPVMTFSVSALVDSLRRSYADTVLRSIDDLPVIAPPPEGLVGSDESPFGDVAQMVADPATAFVLASDDQTFADGLGAMMARARSANDGASGMVEVMPPGDGASAEFARAVAFHRGPATVPVTPDDPARLEALVASVDFHKMLTSLQEHPTLLRRLGMVFDIAIPRTALTDSGGQARLVPQWTSQLVLTLPSFAFPPDSPFLAGPSVDEALWVEWLLREGDVVPFAPYSGSPAGLLDIGGASRFDVEHLAIDAAALQSVSMMSGLPVGGATTAPPALRSGGLMLYLAGRAQSTHAEIAAASDGTRGADREHPLSAEDLIRAYRLDVFDVDLDAWFSLHARRVDYVRDGAPLLEAVMDEGAFQPAATGPHVEPGSEVPADAPMYLHESLVRWDGWSLSAPRPGRSLSVDPSGPDPDRPETMPQRITNDPLTEAGLQIETRVQSGTLPRLRFGRRYLFRVRTVDLAGNGLDMEQAARLWALPSIAEGEDGAPMAASRFGTAEVTFSRFEPVGPPAIVKANPEDESAHRLVVRTVMDDDVKAVVDTTDVDECQLFAPKGTVELAERHGKLDDAIGSRDRAGQRASYELAARESGMLPAAGTDSITYLPDPLAVGIAIAGAPGMPAGLTFAVDWEAETWDRPLPITVRLVANDLDFQPGPDWDEATRTVTIKLDAARRSRIRISSKIPPNTPFGLLEWCRDGVDEATLQGLRRAVDDSRHCMFTPWHDMELVHAVQRPLTVPDLDPEEEPSRKPGDTDYRCTATLIPEPLSTGTLTLSARWTDWIDDPAVEMHSAADGTPPRFTREVTTVVGSTPLAEPQPVDGVFPVIRRTDLYFDGSTIPPLQLSDTRHRRVTFEATAHTRFAEHFPGELADVPGKLSRTGRPVEAFVLNTARPTAPVVLDVVPLQVRSSHVDTADVRRREGGWLRIHLARPWFVTGEGELLGVVVGEQQPSGPGDPMYDLVSLLGTDLAHVSPLAPGLQVNHLENAVPREIGTTIVPESVSLFPDQTPPGASVVPYEPTFDESTQQWYVDVRVNVPDTYFPMVRLAVVRYQPNSILSDGTVPAEHFTMSPVVLLDPVPLLPDRELRVRPLFAPGGEQSGVSLQLSGPTYSSIRSVDGADDASAAARATVTARTQSRLAVDLTSDDGWLTTGSLPFSRSDAEQRWDGGADFDTIKAIDVNTQRLLVVEEDHVANDPAAHRPEPFASRVVFAEPVEITIPVPIETGSPPEGGR